MKAQRYLDSIGYAPEVQGAERHSIQDLASEKRLKLILDTNIKQAQSVARMKASEDPAIANSWPAWELLRVGSRMVPRIDWWQRWQGCRQFSELGRCIADADDCAEVVAYLGCYR